MASLGVNSMFFTALSLNLYSFTQVSHAVNCCGPSTLLFISGGSPSSSARTAFCLHRMGLSGGRVALKELLSLLAVKCSRASCASWSQILLQ